MKRHMIKGFLLIAVMIGSSTISKAADSDSLGMIGDNLDLNAVLESFRTSESIEKFEIILNSSESKINNLDLNEDDQTDYIQVIDNSEGDAHALILRIDLSESESQDVAVIELEKTDKDNATIQIVGDEELYGTDYIVEPIESSSVGNMPPAFIAVNVWGWPNVKLIYGPTYKPWRSPYRWGNYPQTWKPRKPFGWRTYNNFHKGHNHKYHVVHIHRVNNAHKVYHKNRKTSQRIKHHHHYQQHKNHNNQNNHNGHHKKNKKSKGNKKKHTH